MWPGLPQFGRTDELRMSEGNLVAPQKTFARILVRPRVCIGCNPSLVVGTGINKLVQSNPHTLLAAAVVLPVHSVITYPDSHISVQTKHKR
eukprot:scaffold301017_cov24-Tisochrysis_lutea.AAC.1